MSKDEAAQIIAQEMADKGLVKIVESSLAPFIQEKSKYFTPALPHAQGTLLTAPDYDALTTTEYEYAKKVGANYLFRSLNVNDGMFMSYVTPFVVAYSVMDDIEWSAEGAEACRSLGVQYREQIKQWRIQLKNITLEEWMRGKEHTYQVYEAQIGFIIDNTTLTLVPEKHTREWAFYSITPKPNKSIRKKAIAAFEPLDFKKRTAQFGLKEKYGTSKYMIATDIARILSTLNNNEDIEAAYLSHGLVSINHNDLVDHVFPISKIKKIIKRNSDHAVTPLKPIELYHHNNTLFRESFMAATHNERVAFVQQIVSKPDFVMHEQNNAWLVRNYPNLCQSVGIKSIMEES